jgi:hypothetical protein
MAVYYHKQGRGEKEIIGKRTLSLRGDAGITGIALSMINCVHPQYFL